jgi:chromosome segregation ATPase
MENMLKQLIEGQKQIIARLDNMETRLDNIEGQQKEGNQLIGVLLHRTEELGAQVDAIGHTVVRLEGKVNQLDQKVDQLDQKINRMDEQHNSAAGDISFLVRKVGEHDEAIRQLRRAL